MLLQAQTTAARHRPPPVALSAAQAVLTRAETDELAGRFLQARSEAERDHLLAATLIHATHRVGAPLSSQLGRSLGASLKVTRRATVRPNPSILSSFELETLAQDDRAFDAARRFVQVAARAAADAARHPRAIAEASGETFEFDPEMEYFLGGLVRSAGRVVRKVGKTVSKVSKVVGGIPVLGDIARAGVGAARLGLGSTAIALDIGSRLAHGQKLGTALKGAVTGQIDAARSQLKLAEMVAPFVPGIGSGVAAALGAANALAAGKPITEALISAARSSLPGGAVAQAAFDTAVNLARGQSIGDAALGAVRDRLPGGPAARAAFDAATAIAHGRKLQDAAYAAAGRILPPSPYAANALSFVKRVSNGQNVQHAALSLAGQRVVQETRARGSAPDRELDLDLEVRTIGGIPASREQTITTRNKNGSAFTRQMTTQQSKSFHKTASMSNRRSQMYCPEPTTEIIHGWDRYGDNVEKLPMNEQSKIRVLAESVVASFSVGCRPLGQIVVVGHADHDAHGRAFEKKVSTERAISVATSLAAAIKETWEKREMGAFKPGSIMFNPPPQGVGATEPDPVNYPRVKNRALNRRVVVMLVPFGAPARTTWTWRDAARRALSIIESNKSAKLDAGKRNRIRCVLNRVLATGTIDAYALWEDFVTKDGTTVPRDPKTWANSIIRHFRDDLGVRSAYGPEKEVTDEEYLYGLSSWDDAVTRTLRNINNVYKATQVGGGATLMILLRWRAIFQALDVMISDDRHIMSCYSTYWRQFNW